MTGRTPPEVVALADAVGSTSAILQAAREMDAREFIVATDNGMMHKLRTLNPGKVFIEAPTAGNSATCKSCAHCPWMAMNALQGVLDCLEKGTGEITVPEDIRAAIREKSAGYADPVGFYTDKLAEGVATLRGEVPSFFHKQVAQNIARHIPGIRGVVNSLEVRR